MSRRYRTGGHAVHDIQDHLCWCTKYIFSSTQPFSFGFRSSYRASYCLVKWSLEADALASASWFVLGHVRAWPHVLDSASIG